MSRLFTNTTIGERRRGCIFSENFINSTRVTENGGTITGSPTIENGVVFDGTNNKYIAYNTNPFSNPKLSNLTFIGTFIPNAPDLASARGMIQGGSATNSFPVITTLNGKMIYYANSSQFKYGATDLVAGQEYHYAITTDGTMAGTNLYLNGKLDNGAATASSGDPTPWTYLMIGKRGLAGTTYYDGTVKSLKIFNKILTPLEIYQAYKGDTEFDDVVYTDDCSTDKWTSTANVTKEFLTDFQGEANVMKITATSTSGITLSPSPAIATEVGILYKATLRVWVPTTNGGVNWYWDSSAGGNPRNTTALKDQWVDLDVFFIGTGTTQAFYLNPISNGNSCYVTSLIVSKFNSQVCDVDLRFRPEDFNGTTLINHADATNPFIADNGVGSQLKYGGMRFSGTGQGMVSTKALDYKYHGVETMIIAYTVEPKGASYWVATLRDSVGGSIGILHNEGTGNIEFYVGVTGLGTLNTPFNSSNVVIFQRVMNVVYVWVNGNYIGTATFTGNQLEEGQKLYLGKRGGSTALLLKGTINRLKHCYGFMTEKQVQQITMDFMRSIKGGESV